MTTGRIKVYVQPRASKSEIIGWHADGIRIRIAAPPVNDAANDELIAVVAARLNIRKSAVRIIAGRTGRRKLVEVDGVDSDQLTHRLIGA